MFDVENSKIYILFEICELFLFFKCKEYGFLKLILLCLDSEGYLWVGDGEKEVFKLF